jgi:radical SAM protein with 4Fe4S-binding SPASM domain
MSNSLADNLYTARLLTRFVDMGQAYLGNLLKPASLALHEPVAVIARALWDRSDTRPTALRLEATDIDAQLRDFVVSRMLDAGLLVSSDFNEPEAWYSKLQSELQAVPLVDQVELTNACPFTCVFCPRGLGKMQRPIGHMDLGLLADIVAQVKHLQQRKPFGLHHFGESLLHPDPIGAVRIVAQAGLSAELSVNPILLKEAVAESILDAGVGVLIISLDGLDTATLQKIRGKVAGEFELIEAKIEWLIKRISQMSQPPTLMISMVATRHNQHQWAQLFARYKRPDLPWLTPVVRLLENFGDKDIIPVGTRPLQQLCGSPYKFVSILWDGAVVPCCHDYNGRIVYGNVRQQSLAEIWQSDAVQSFRSRWLQNRFNDDEPCAHCNWRVDTYMASDQVATADAWSIHDWELLDS